MKGRAVPLTGERTVPGIPRENYWFQRHVAAYRFAERFARGRALDVGAGEGYGAAKLGRRMGTTVVAVEYDRSVAAHAAGTYPAVRLAVGDACHLPVRDGSFDVVAAMQVLEHLFCADRFVASCARALRPGGVFVLSTPNRPTFSPDGVLNPFHVYEYEASELRALLSTRFGSVELYGLRHRGRLRFADAALREPLQRRLIRAGYDGLPGAQRGLLRSARPRHFRVTTETEGALDLLAVCRA